MGFDIKKLSEQEILENIRTLSINIQTLNGQLSDYYTTDDFINMDENKMIEVFKKYGFSDAKDRVDIILEYKKGLDFIFGDFFKNTQENFKNKVTVIIDELNSKISEDNNKVAIDREQMQLQINFLNKIWHYLYELDNLSEDEYFKLNDFIMSSDLSDDEKVYLSSHISMLIIRRNSLKNIVELREFDENLSMIDSEIDTDNDVIEEINRESEDGVLGIDDQLVLKINKLDIDLERKQLLYDLLKKYEKIFQDYASDTYLNLNFYEWFDEEDNKYVIMEEISKKAVVGEDEFYQILETIARDLIECKNEEKVNRCKDILKKIMENFNCDDIKYEDSKKNLISKIKELEEKVKLYKESDELKEYCTSLNTLKMELLGDNVFSDSRLLEVEKDLENIENGIDNYDEDDENVELLNSKEIDECSDEEIYDLIDSMGNPKKIIFAMASREPYVLKDIKKIDKVYYKTIYQKLLLIENGVRELNLTKERVFTSTNRKLGKLAYKKGGKVRVYYKSLSDDAVYVVFVNIIKTTKGKKKIEGVKERVSHVSSEYEEYKKLFKSKDENDIKKRDRIIEENLILRDQIYEYLGEEPINIKGHGRD